MMIRPGVIPVTPGFELSYGESLTRGTRRATREEKAKNLCVVLRVLCVKGFAEPSPRAMKPSAMLAA